MALRPLRDTARIAHAVLRIECARQCRAFGRPLDRELLSNAIEQSDLLLVHYADPERLATSPGWRPGQTTLPSEAQPRYFDGSSAGLT